MKAYVVGTHLICMVKLIQFKWVSTINAFYKEADRSYELLDCALIGVYEVIRSNTVI